MPEILAHAGAWDVVRVMSIWGSVRYWLRRQGCVELCLTEDDYRELRAAMTATEAA